MANEGKIAENIANSAANGAVSSVAKNTTNKVPKHTAVHNSINNTTVDSNNAPSSKQIRTDILNSYNNSNNNSDETADMSSEEKREYLKQKDIENNAKALDTAADIAANSGNAYAKFFGNLHKILAKNNWYRNFTAKTARTANKLAPGAQSIVNKAAQSDTLQKVGKALANKSVEKAGEEAGKKVAENASKEAAKEALSKASESRSSSDSKEFYKNPIFWIVAGIPVTIVFLIIYVVLLSSDALNMYGTGEFPYAQMDFSKTIKVKTGNSYSNVAMDDYVAGVLPAEVGEFSSSKETLKAAAIAARTYALKKMKTQGYVINSTANQVYNSDSKFTKSGNVFYEAAHATAGVVLVTGEEGNYSFMNTEYDALAINESCGGSETADTFTLCQKGVQIPVAWAKSHGLTEGALNIYRKAYHGRGMSQWGAFYLASEQNYDYKRILNLFYDNPKIVSLYPPAPKKSEIALEITVTPSKASQLTHNSVANFLSSKGKDIKSVNDGLRDAVIKAGPGTREGVATAALYLINTFLEYDIRLPYQMGGGWAGNCKFDCRTNRYYGINPKWGSAVDNKSAKYNSLGMDCASFVTWAFHTGGLSYPSGDIKQFGYLSGEHVKYHNVKNTSEYKGQPGDFMYHPGHVMLILGYYSEGNQEGYYIAEASGYQNDIRVIKRSISSLSSTNKIGEMTYHYKNSRVSDYKSAFDKGRLD